MYKFPKQGEEQVSCPKCGATWAFQAPFNYDPVKDVIVAYCWRCKHEVEFFPLDREEKEA